MKYKVFKWFLSVICLFAINNVNAETSQWKQGAIYRDPQIESFLLNILQPLYREASLNPTLVQPRVIVNPQYNAFATLENLIVVHTGFVLQTKTVEEMAGVLAHETGHQAGRHILRTISGVLPQAATTMVLGAAVGGALSVLTGHPEIGMVSILGAQNLATSQFTEYSRGQERTADDYAVQLLQKLGWPLWGFKDATNRMLELTKQNRSTDLPIYLQTHPASIERREYVDRFMEASHKGNMSKPYQYGFAMMKARIAAFTLPEVEINALYSDASKPEGVYAKALFSAVKGDYTASIAQLTQLIKQHPMDPYLVFARAEVYQAAGKSELALADLNSAISMAEKTNSTGRKEVIMRFERAATNIMLKQPKPALQEMVQISQWDKDLRRSPSFWSQYARIYDLLNNKTMVSYALAEANLVVENIRAAERYIEVGKQAAQKGSEEWIKFQDLELRIKQMKKKP